MPTKSRFWSLSLLALLAAPWSFAQTPAPAAVADASSAAAHLLVYGKPAEVEANATDPSDFAACLQFYQQQLNDSPEAAKAVAARAQLDGLGALIQTSRTDAEANLPYFEWMARHVERLAEDRAAYEAVIHRAYQWVIHRDAYAEELAYWHDRPALSFVLLVGCIEDWARRNQPGLMVTTGRATISINCPYLSTVRLTPETAEHARAAVGLAPPETKGNHVIAPGAEPVASSGGIHFVAVGADLLREASARNSQMHPDGG